MPASLRASSILPLLVAACGGSATPANSVTGKLRGQPFPTLHATAAVHEAPSGASPDDISQLGVVLTTDAAFPCDLVFAEAPKGARSIGVGLTTFSAKKFSVPAAGGSFSISAQNGEGGALADGNYALATYLETDAQCIRVKANNSYGVTGTVKVDRFSTAPGGRVSGSFDAIFDTGERVQGSFDTTLCAASPGSSLDGGSGSFCQ